MADPVRTADVTAAGVPPAPPLQRKMRTSVMEKRERILVVDDQPVNVRTLNEILRQDYNISVATNGSNALALVAADTPDLILLDIMMPEMDGYEVCRRLKADETTCSIPVIFVTAMGEEEDETKGLKLGAVDYITKPVSPSLVKARVHNHLQLKKQHDQLKVSVSILHHETEILQQKADLGIQAGGLAHDLNNVLASAMVIDILPSLLPAGLEQEKTINDVIRHVKESLKLGREICQGYTSYLRDMGEDKKVQPVLPLLQPLDMYARQFKGRLTQDIQANLPPVRCKGHQIKRVLVNLFTNACQAVEGVRDQLITVRLWSENNRVFLALADNGPGIAADVLPHIFSERFTTRENGTGLGLFMAKNIITAHGGTIEVDSREGMGTTFTISLPAEREV